MRGWGVIVVCVGLWASTAKAEPTATATVTAAGVTEPPAPPRPAEPRTGPVAKPAAEPVAAPPSDHSLAVGRIGVGFAGARDLALGTLDNTFPAPTLAARMWVTERWALELGLGLGHTSGTLSLQQPGSTTTTIDAATQWGINLQVGAPIALAWGAHYAFVLTPEARLGLAWMTPGGDPAATATSDNGAHGTTFELGGRAGAELHFGFIGVPELALEASVGLFLRYVDVGSTTSAATTAATALDVGTADYNDPWDFFRSSVAARYYF